MKPISHQVPNHIQWLLKSEPSTFSIQALSNCVRQTEPWNGVRNYQARNYLKAMNVGDWGFFYHSSCKEPGIVGLVEIVRAAYPDHTAWDDESPYFDPKSTPENPRWFMVDVQLRQIFSETIPLSLLKRQIELNDMPLVKTRCRLSVMPVQSEESKTILELFP